MSLLRAARVRALDMVRRGREVAWCPEWMNLGNLLYIGVWALEGESRGSPRRILLQPSKAASLAVFPELRRRFFVERSEVRFTDRRVMPWSGREEHEPDRYDDPLLVPYIEQVLLPGSPLNSAPEDLDDDAMVVNVRRGDYFSVPEHRAAFGIDTVAYTLEAVRASVDAHGAPSSIVVVSDDTAWCREYLRALDDVAPVRVREGSATDDLAALVHAPRLILPNSTFSYWGGYIGDVIHPEREVVAPWFFDRTARGGKAGQLRPSWHRIDEIPGGWGEPAA
ncbi:alpha-1,2-fucosyltransferase [Brachybacterium halotolerans subsp. kimchii]|uniref:alpha-1,2-fucosyltransferase n=1 Tax=Brachybacterium halotolerans TaxID=2795215 RepID=UPI001E2D242D|nr:alpha-1,2-fucosyltransferase [Brachybacterium halotolerans]UEJ81122.1 alpha-1,2-fucosyltransferase [Brachybacterium halotolerans subsp. kimchii]